MSIKEAPLVPVLRFDEKAAYNHDRPISSLIRTQLLHLHYAEHLKVPPQARTNKNINDLRTERQASEYIQEVTRLLHKYGKPASGRKAAAKKKKVAKKPVSRPKKKVSRTTQKQRSRRNR